ncbi:TonB family protein [Taibaiella soli]|uniref:TonB C-terminal domain-containing protein n=1 Tax=Taibaiella soli TaxID=1649169 RepID=A0A2W2AA94_9BACT|nr:M56 family metallopeptidase [Taibaiella soli]PZF72315.1 hypothetical protein DN068_13230 [Taibaiella soli]
MSFFLYLTQASLYAFVMWGIYLLIGYNKPHHRLSRAYLLAATLLPTILPFIRIPVERQSTNVVQQLVLPSINIGATHTANMVAGFSWWTVLICSYFTISALLALVYIGSYFQINRRLKKGQQQRLAGYTVFTETRIGPGTIGKKIFFPSEEIDETILQHELAHIQSGHRYDSFFLQIIQVLFWISPAHWLLGRELKTVHEFEADQIASQNADLSEYATLLLSHTFGTKHSFHITHSFFHHPLKRRIMMLQKIRKPQKRNLVMSAFVLTAIFVSTVLLAQTKKTTETQTAAAPQNDSLAQLDAIAQRMNAIPKPGEVQFMADGSIVFKTAEKMPHFDGDFSSWLKDNMRYPEAAKARGEHGKGLIQFTVGADGSIINPHVEKSSGYTALDEETLRVVRKMPNWRPGILKGRAIPVICLLPFNFTPDGKVAANEGC